MCVLISFARSAYFKVLIVWWYWLSAGEIVAIMTVWEFPLRPSLRIRVSLLQKLVISYNEGRFQTTITIQIPITIRDISKALFLLFSQSIDAVCQSKKWTINICSISQLLTTTICFRSSFTAWNPFYGSTHTIYFKYNTKPVERWETKNKATELTCRQDPQVQVFLWSLDSGICFFVFF